ncbi:hypothetical protein PVAND_007796 [Polypedilum vanderplanki]|uniref:Uncharacterized protein n=1 Tax=Polypedilum vanderplanki TaxID=319348 RepID=A0A9J6C8X1_POLVA|nr:hypothetical protein PVAND_007796 [Polypedilum vanderplanki]
MKILNLALLLIYLSFSYGNPVKRDGANYEVFNPDGVPIKINVDQSEESKSTETVPLEFPLDKAISVDQLIFKDGEWQAVEKPAVVIKRIIDKDDSSWVNKEASHESPIKIKSIHSGIGRERKDQFDSQPKDDKNKSEPSMSASEENKKVKLHSEASMSASVDRKLVKKIEKLGPMKKVQVKKLNKMKSFNSEASMSASAEVKPLEKIEKIAKLDSEPSMSASVEDKKVPDQVIIIPLEDTNNAKEIDFIIEPNGEQIIKIERNSASNEISYNLIDSDMNSEHIEVKKTKMINEDEEKKIQELEKQMGLLSEFYQRILSSFMAAVAFGNPFGSVVAYE